jgi:hypothetical protein
MSPPASLCWTPPKRCETVRQINPEEPQINPAEVRLLSVLQPQRTPSPASPLAHASQARPTAIARLSRYCPRPRSASPVGGAPRRSGSKLIRGRSRPRSTPKPAILGPRAARPHRGEAEQHAVPPLGRRVIHRAGAPGPPNKPEQLLIEQSSSDGAADRVEPVSKWAARIGPEMDWSGNGSRPTPNPGVGLLITLSPAVSYSPTLSRVQYHRRWRA